MNEAESVMRDRCRRWALQKFEELGIEPIPLDGSEGNSEETSSDGELTMSSTTKYTMWMLKNELSRKKA